MSYFALSLDADHDLHLTPSGELATVRDAAAVAQLVTQHLKFWAGEWFLDTSAGVPWLEFVFVIPFDQATAEAVIKDAILAVPGVRGITAFDVEIMRSSRRLNVWRLTILTEFDEEVTVNA